MHLLIQADGTILCLYDETIDLASLGKLAIDRGSHVEPATEGGWLADLSPVNGPQLGPFATRSLALDAEREWLETHWLKPGT